MKTSVFCVQVGKKYPIEYVRRLYKMIERNTTHLHDFFCITDDPKSVDLGHAIVLPTPHPSGWWAKLELFNLISDDQILYFDLDTVIVGNIDKLFEYKGKFCILKDFWQPCYNSSVMSIAPGFGWYIWRNYITNPGAVEDNFAGDQNWITHEVMGADVWQDFAPGVIGSYKADRLTDNPKDFSLVCFHGKPKPHEIEGGWVAEHWL